MKILDIGCGANKCAGEKGDTVVGLDIEKRAGVDVVFDLEKKKRLPFRDASFDAVNCRFVLEHIDNLVFVVKEICRVCKPGGTVRITVPHYASKDAFTSPYHRRFFTIGTFDPKYYGGCFELKTRRFTFNRLFLPVSLFANAYPGTYEKFFCFWFPPGGLYFELAPNKKPRA
ncbi:Ubiquinone/menaquinone biosynthesis C-methyltransferase UbiE [Candidatus Norongarragalina meridionalis]|nr:Ubiquinone/menaquinone biosynthesis C-methyltransferase UbiE [Candidatus Norongarragalina meridionalis]